MTILLEILAKYGVATLKALINPLVLLIMASLYIGGGATGWFKAKHYYTDAYKVAQLQAAVAKKTLENTALSDAQAATSKQLAERADRQAKQDSLIASFTAHQADLKSAGACNDSVGDDLIKQMHDLDLVH